MKSFRDMAKSSADKKMKMYGASSDEVSSKVNNAEKYGCGGPIKKADGGSVGSQDLDEMDGGMSKHRGDRGAKKASTTVNIIVGKGPDAVGAPMASPAPMPPGPMPGPAAMPPMRKYGGRVAKADGGSISEDSKREIKRLQEENQPRALKAVGQMALGATMGVLGAKGLGRAFGSRARTFDKAALGGAGAIAAAKDTENANNLVSTQREIDRLKAGRAEDGKEDRKNGGRVNLTGGADSGIGRLEKNHKK